MKSGNFTFLGSANWQLAGQSLIRQGELWLNESLQEVPVPFGQWRSLLIEHDSQLRQADPEFCIFCERFEDFLPSAFSGFDETMGPAIEDAFAAYLKMLTTTREHLSGVFFIFDLAPAKALSHLLCDTVWSTGEQGVHALVQRLNRQLADWCASQADCYLLPLSQCLGWFGAEFARPLKYWQVGRFPYSPEFVDALCELVIGAIMVLRGKTSRVLVLDLDNTLWGGVIGDDGIAGIELGDDYPGNSYVAIQHAARSLRAHGVVLALCSKNSEMIAEQAIREHPSMVLREDDFVVRCINWQDKPTNLRDLAAEIGVGLGSLCLIDDSPYEREAVRQTLPEVIVPELPSDPAEWPDFIVRLPCFAMFSLTQEDRERASYYAARTRSLQSEALYTSQEDYRRSLGMQLGIHALDEGNRRRILQLIAKTNQFNTTTRRYTQQDIASMQAAGAEVFAISLADRFSAREIIGVLILIPQDRQILAIDSFILSCRVLGRGMEAGVLAWVSDHARRCGYSKLVGVFIPTERNQPAADLYPSQGFTPLSEGGFALDIGESCLTMPDWFEVIQ
jgi:FkbH-like protein